MIFEPNENSKHVRRTAQGVSWMNEDNILCSYYVKDGPARLSDEEQQAGVDYAYDLVKKYGKLKILTAIDHSPPSVKSDRDAGAPLLEEITDAMALVGSQPLARLAAKMFFGLKPSTYPVKIFKEHEEAIEWLRNIND